MGTVVPLTSAWGAWLAFGLLLALWAYRARRSARESQVRVSAIVRPLPKPRSEIRRPVKTAVPDAFGELQDLLEGPGAERKN